MGDISIKGRSPLLKGGRVGFSRAGPVGNLPWVRGTSRPGVKKAPRGAEHKEAIKQERVKDTGLHKGSVRKATSPKVMGTQRPKTKSDFWLKQSVKKIQKMPDKKFKDVNLETRTYKSDRTGKMVTVQKSEPVKGSVGKKNYIQEMKRYHHANKPKYTG